MSGRDWYRGRGRGRPLRIEKIVPIGGPNYLVGFIGEGTIEVNERLLLDPRSFNRACRGSFGRGVERADDLLGGDWRAYVEGFIREP